MLTRHLFAQAPLIPISLLVACASAPPPTVSFPTREDPSGCVVEQITSAPFGEFQVFGVSKDGQWLSYSWDRGEEEKVLPRRGAVNLNLLTGEQVTLDERFSNAGTFSPDGAFLVGAHYENSGRTDIYELHLETGKTKTIAQHEQWDWLPSYSPDGRYILFNSYREGAQSDLYLFERETEELRRLTDFEGYEAHGQFSPDGESILFHRMNGKREDGGFDFDLIVLSLSSGEEQRLTSGPFEESYAAFSPDGEHVVYSSDFETKPEKHNLYVLNRAGEGVSRLTRGVWKDSYAYWTPDGKYVYFNSDRSGVTNVYRIPMNGLDCVRG